MARRPGYTYNNRKVLWNNNESQNELHDLDKEQSGCKIDEIKLHHIEMFDTVQQGINAQKVNRTTYNGCKHCLPEYHTG